MLRDRLDEGEAGRLDADLVALDDPLGILAAELVAALAADGDDLDVLAVGDAALRSFSRAIAHDAGVEAAARPRSEVATTIR